MARSISIGQPTLAIPRVEPRSLVMASLFAGAVVLGWAILPGQAERIAMLERDGKTREALALLEHRFAAGDRSPRTLFQLEAHYEQFGDLANARKTLEMLTDLRPRDPQALRRLAAFYKGTQDADAYVATLKRVLELRYFEDTCRELIGLLRQRGDFAGEQSTLQDCRQKGYRRADDLIRLASMLAVDGDLTGALSLLRSADDLRRLKSEPDRLRLFQILLSIDQPREALRRAVRWVRGQRNEPFIDLLVDQLVIANRQDTALAMLREIGPVSDGVALTVADLLTGTGQDEAARTYLRGLLDTARLGSPVLASRYIRSALDAGDPQLALRAARRLGLSRVQQEDTALLVEALAGADQSAEAETVRAYLRPETISRLAQPRPAGAVRGARSPEPAQPQTLASREMDSWRLALWTRLSAARAPSGEAAPSGQSAGSHAVVSPARARRTVRLIRRIRKAKPALHGKSPPSAFDPYLPSAKQ